MQYRETSLDFMNRLLEEEGIFYFFIESGGKEKLVLTDGASGYKPVVGDPKIPFRSVAVGDRRNIEHIFDLRSSEKVTSGKVTLNDYDFERPQADLFSMTALPKGSHEGKDHEIYDYPGHYRLSDDGKRNARIRMEAEAVRHMTIEASGNITTLGSGLTFDLIDHPRTSENKGYVVTRAVHAFQLTGGDKPPLGVKTPIGMSAATGGGADYYQVKAHAIPKAEQYRAPLRTPWPQIVGVHTAVVVGPSGEEIYPDKYGRVKVQFHWDRLGKKNETSSLWIRSMMPWTGKNWGMIALPRIGQEVVVQFEEGNPDRPVIIGMLYNADTMPPYTLPGEMTKSGVVTRSSK
ncbi:MAG TPA: type VI secretion system tip protein TssI/VgrG, partial [Pirellulaceae bacterium]